MIKVLHEWKGLDEIFEKEFDSSPPDERYASLVAFEEDGETSFLVVEDLTLVYQIYVAPKHKGRSVAQRLIRRVEERVPSGQAILCIASEERFKKLFESKGMREIPGTLFRKDFP